MRKKTALRPKENGGQACRTVRQTYGCNTNKCSGNKLTSRPILKPTKSNKCTKHAFHHFEGMLALKSGLSFFCFGTRSDVFWHLKTGTFGESAHFQVPKKWHFGHWYEKRRPLPPKWWNECLFSAFITAGWSGAKMRIPGAVWGGAEQKRAVWCFDHGRNYIPFL